MRNLLFPAVTLMNRLKYLQKIFLIGMLFMLPVGLSMYLIVAEIDKEIDFAKKERVGIEYNNGIRKLLEHLQQHRGMANANLNGDASFKEKLLIKQAQIEDDIRNIDQIDQKSGISLKTTEKWHSVKEKWGNLEGGIFDLQPQESFVLHNTLIKENFELHSIIITDILSLFVHVGDTSSLKLDPGHDSYYLMDTMVNKLPLIIEKTGQSRGLGTGIAAKKTLTPEEKVQLIILSGMIQSAMNDVKSHMDLFEDPRLQILLQPYIQDNLNATKLFLELLNNEIIDAKSIQIQSAKFYEIATIAIDSGFKLYDVESPNLDNLLIERMNTLSKRKLVVMGLACIVFLLISYLFAAFYVSVIRTVTTLKRASVRFSGGDLSARVDLRTKDELQHVGNAFNKMVDAFANMMEERKRYEERIEYQAFYDALTGLPNRILFNDRLKLALSEALRCRKMVAVMFLDLDRFKVINDTLGHDIGDLLLKAVTSELTGCLRQRDTVSRMGGDEFLFILPDIGGIDQARVVAKKILDHLNKPILAGSHELFISASIGISLFPFDGEDLEHLVKNADTAMYVAKNNGRNSYQFYDPYMNAKAEKSLQMENSLRRALERSEFLLHYQPRFDLTSGRITGMEALIRWQHPELGLVPPADFIPLAEELGLIVPIGEWVLRTACLQNKGWQEEGIRISVNISASQFQRDGFIDTVKRVLEETSMEPRWLELELTESVIMNNATMAVVKLKQLKEMGIQISIDDFGTGFSSLSYLKYFPIDSLKIDRSFIKDIPSAPKDTAITKTIIALGRRLGLKVVAEGVETEEQFEFLSSRRCNEVQGYLISRPLPPDEAIGLLREKAAWNNKYFNRGVEGL
jgi:diguanylate cyclase (GGDEF)-like protein